MKKILILILFLLYGCGYTSIYKNTDTLDFKINITSMSGNSEMNNLIKSELNPFSKNNSSKKFNLNIDTKFEKIIISKKTSGAIDNYKIYVKTTFDVKLNDKMQKLSFEEKFNIKNITNTFEQKKYEKIVKRNFASSIKEKLLIKLSSFNDN
tara:strand:+ start:391 stop:846 length:456 start_codon:yes stop_codon:yes gene_type:complete